MTNYTKEAEMALAAYMKQHAHFHGPTTSMDDGDANFSLDDASKLIQQAKLEKERILKAKANQEQVDHLVGQQRESVGILKDAEALRILEEAREQARNYASARNRGASPKAFDPNSKEEVDIRNGIKTWIESKRKKNWFKKTD